MSAAGVAVMLGGAGILLAAGPVRAAEVSYATECVPPPISGLPPVRGTTRVLITAPAEAKVGDEIEVVWRTVEAASRNPGVLDLEKDTVKPAGTIRVTGAWTADLAVAGPRQNPPIPKNSPMVLPDMTGRLKLTRPGEITLTPGAYTINVSKPLSTDTTCAPEETVRPAHTIKVTEGGDPPPTGGTASGGTASGGTATGGTASGGTSGGGDGGPAAYPGKEVSVPYACRTPIGDKQAISPVRIDARGSGGSYALTVRFSRSVMDSPADIPAGTVKPSMEVALGGADKGTVHVEGPANKEPIKAGSPIGIPDLTGTYKPGATGRATLSPGVLTVEALGTTTTCTPPPDVRVSLELDTTAQPGGASGGTSSGGTGSAGPATGGSSASGGGLAETGAEDGGALRALALVAGTVVLLGGAVFAFTPWRLLRR
ncbi:hypothetical protein ACIRD2_15545 [Streptomyces sp. NPDC093595]|uniref:hypothetical protein n=1 Tax=Streptomyces sp. NPDC093595 TaxID=3366045 RepID=UPI00382F20CF